MADKNDQRYERRGFDPFNVGYIPIAPPGYDPKTHEWVLKEPGGARSGESPPPWWHQRDDKRS